MTLLKSLEQKGVRGKSRVLRRPPAHNTTQDAGKHLSHSSGPKWSHSYPHSTYRTSVPPLRE